MNLAPISAVVLAGGHSTRMGFDKSSARLRDGLTLLDRVLQTVSALSGDVILVANEPKEVAGYRLRIVGDVFRGAGSLGGVYSGLRAASHEHAMVVGCDMPFLSLPLWRHMLSLPRDFDVLMPRLGGQYEPLHAVYSHDCIEPIERVLKANRYRVVDFLPEVKARYLDEAEIDALDPQRLSFFNVNTPEDLVYAQQLL